MQLELTEYGTAKLIDSQGHTLWASDADEAFKDEFGDEFLDEEDDADILDYLVDAGHLTDEDADAVEIMVSTLDTGDTIDPDSLDTDEDDDNGR